MARPSSLSLLWRLLTTVRNPWTYVWNRLGLMRRPFSYKLWDGTKVMSRPFAIDRMSINDVWLEQSYEPNHYGIPFDWKSVKNIIDIGANTGTFTLFAAWRARNAQIHSVEPEPGNLKILEANVHQNNLQNRVHIHPVAMGAKEEALTLHINHQSSGGHSLHKYTNDSHGISVPVKPLMTILDQLNGATCDFLKMDCEGAEYDILYTLPEETFARLPFMAVEFHHFSDDPTHRPGPLKEFLTKKGYNLREHKKSLCFAYKK